MPSRLALPVVLLIVLGSVAHGRPAGCIDVKVAGAALLEALAGAWKGSAHRTPLGPVPYDIEFVKAGSQAVRGRSTTNGQAVHSWSLALAPDGTMGLDFHTTFGNSHAKGLCVTRRFADGGLLFSGGRPVHLQVRLHVASDDPDRLHARIALRGRPHVAITARRTPPGAGSL